jgi:hypothetical protein
MASNSLTSPHQFVDTLQTPNPISETVRSVDWSWRYFKFLSRVVACGGLILTVSDLRR